MATAPPGPSVFAAAAPVGGDASVGTASQGLRIVAPPAQEAHLVVVAPSDGAEASTASATASHVTIVAPPAPTSGASPSSPPPGAPIAGAPAAARPPHLDVGDQFSVALNAPLAISTAWQAVPAVATAKDGPLTGWRLIGQAQLASSGTPQITWTRALSPDGTQTLPLQAVAYNAQTGVPEVPGSKAVPMSPQAARTVLSGTLAAVGQYVNAQLSAEQTEVVGLTATLTSQVPPFWQFVASQLATGFQPAPVQTGGIIMVSEIPAGTSMTVFVTAPTS